MRSSRHTESAEITVADLVSVVAVFTAAFGYLEVPYGNALLIGFAVSLHAAFGTYVLTRVFTGVTHPLLFLIGPGLIVGGALSFALFQLVGRGLLGLAAVGVAGLASALRLANNSGWRTNDKGRFWTISQLVGLAALAMTWEFGELLPVAAGLFICGFFTASSPRYPRVVRWLAIVLAGGLAVIPLLLRRPFWWLVTDDYQLFEVMSRHFTRDGVFAGWGDDNWLRYHWLSYAWSGLLNYFGGSPDAFVTLTRVMPVTYSLSLGASLLLVAAHLSSDRSISRLAMLSAWAIVALNRLDWSGTSTSGVYAALAAFVALAVTQFYFGSSRSARFGLCTIGALVISLTKMPSFFAFLVFVMLFETWIETSRWRFAVRNALRVFAMIIVTVLVVAAIAVVGNKVGGWDFGVGNASLGELGQFGDWFAVLGLVFGNFWWWIAILVAAVWMPLGGDSRAERLAKGLAYVALPLALVALISDLRVLAPRNTAQYVSDPTYFLASLVLLPSTQRLARSLGRWVVRLSVVLSGVLVGAGFLWERQGLGVKLWDHLGTTTFQWNPQKVEVLQSVTADGRFALALTALPIALVGLLFVQARHLLLISLPLALATFTIIGYTEHSMDEFARERSAEEIASNYGSEDVRAVGDWLSQNSSYSDIVATNYLVGATTGGSISDFVLAVWSDREFLVLGPQLGADPRENDPEISASLDFAERASDETCRELLNRGVRWFIVDLRLTETRAWTRCASQVFTRGDFVVLRLTI